MRAALLLLFALVAACGGAQSSTGSTPPPGSGCPRPEADPPSGVWIDEETRAYLVIGIAGGEILTLFTIDDDGEVWPVTDAAWDGTTLTFTTYVPSTGYTLRRTLALSPDGAELLGSHQGSHTGAGDVWKRAPGR